MGLAHTLEAGLVGAALRLLRALGPVRASNLGGWVARSVGPWLPVSRVAHRNLAMAMPELSEDARRRIVRGVWDNLGRTAAELPHLAELAETASGPGYETAGLHHLPAHGPLVLVSGHLGNWEMLPVVAARVGLRMASFYRAAANRQVDALISGQRARASAAPSFAKGAKGAKEAMAWLRSGGALGMVMDQKMNDGIEAKLFGRPAMTATAAAVFAVRFGCPIVPSRVVRLGPARLRVVCEAPLACVASGDRAADVAALTQAINDRLEAWIRATPEQWLWLHRRWPNPVAAPVTAATAGAPRSSWPPAPPRRHPQS